MARMKFICDAERCIECNGCVTACKNEHEVPWGVNRRRVVTLNDGVPGERVDLGRLHALLRRALHGGVPGRLLLPHRRRRGAARQGRLHRLRLLLLRLPVRRAAVPDQRHLRPARQDGQVHLLRRRPRGQRLARPSSRSTAATAWPKASCRPAPRCARPRRCSAATATWSPTSSATACSSAARAAKSGAGARPTASKQAGQPPEEPSHEARRRDRRVPSRRWLRWRPAARSRRRMRQRAEGRHAGLPGRAACRFAAPGWKHGDKASWEQQLQDARPEAQNDYTQGQLKLAAAMRRCTALRCAAGAARRRSALRRRRPRRRRAAGGTCAAAPAPGGIQGQNIVDVKPGSSPTRRSDPKYLDETNARAQRGASPATTRRSGAACASRASAGLQQPARSQAPKPAS